jgi:signal peptidase II
MAPKWIWFVALLVATVALDQGTKRWAHGALADRPRGDRVELIAGHLELEYAENRGAAFSSLQGGGARWPLVVAALFGLAVIGFALWRADPDQRAIGAALGLLAGGALGNGIDRAVSGRVIDFILARWGTHRWPDFNVADAALVVGITLLVLSGFRKAPRKAPLSAPAPR